MAEPFRLKRWRSASSPEKVQFFTCARPGRSKGSTGKVGDDLQHQWVRGLPGDTNTIVVSLLGCKPDGVSEYSFYSFYEHLSFQQWLAKYHKNRSIQMVEHPTCDFRTIPQETLDAVASDVSRLLSEGLAVVLMDSGGITRTSQICKRMGFIEDSRGPGL